MSDLKTRNCCSPMKPRIFNCKIFNNCTCVPMNCSSTVSRKTQHPRPKQNPTQQHPHHVRAQKNNAQQLCSLPVGHLSQDNLLHTSAQVPNTSPTVCAGVSCSNSSTFTPRMAEDILTILERPGTPPVTCFTLFLRTLS